MQLSIDLSLTGTVTLGGVAVLPRTYEERVLVLGPVAYWPMTETSGTAGADATGNGYNGTFARDVSTMGTVAGPVAGETAPVFDPASDYLDVLSAGLITALGDMSAGTFSTWYQVRAASVWTDGVNRQVVRMHGNVPDNYIFVRKASGDDVWRFEHKGGGTTKSIFPESSAPTDWAHVAITWGEGGIIQAYLDGVIAGASSSGVGAWTQNLDEFFIGAASSSPGEAWDGQIGHAALWDRALSPAEIATIATT